MYMRGLDWNSLKKTPSLIPLFVIVSLGVTGAALYSFRVLLKNPEVRINKKGNPEPWNEYKHKQYKFYSPLLKEEHLQNKIPEY